MGIQFLTQFTWDTIVYTQCCALGHAEPKIDFGFLLIIPKKNWVFDRFFWVMQTFAQNWAMRLPKIFYSEGLCTVGVDVTAIAKQVEQLR